MMQHSLRPASLTRRGACLATFAALALLLGASLLPAGGFDPTSAAAPTPSYDDLRELLRAGAGKGLETGGYEIQQLHTPLPTAWVWAVDSTKDGSGVEYWAMTADFIHPSDVDDDVSMRFLHRMDAPATSIEDFVAWIVANNAHVQSARDLDVHKSVVSKIL